MRTRASALGFFLGFITRKPTLAPESPKPHATDVLYRIDTAQAIEVRELGQCFRVWGIVGILDFEDGGLAGLPGLLMHGLTSLWRFDDDFVCGVSVVANC